MGNETSKVMGDLQANISQRVDKYRHQEQSPEESNGKHQQEEQKDKKPVEKSLVLSQKQIEGTLHFPRNELSQK